MSNKEDSVDPAKTVGERNEYFLSGSFRHGTVSRPLPQTTTRRTEAASGSTALGYTDLHSRMLFTTLVCPFRR